MTRVCGIDELYEHVVADWPSGHDPSRAVIGVADINPELFERSDFLVATVALTGDGHQ